MARVTENVAVVRDLLAAIERFDVGRAAELYHPDVVQTEHPNLLTPAGQVRGHAKMMSDLPRGAKVLRSQRYVIGTMLADGDRVAVEARWEGVLAVPIGRLSPGEKMVAQISMFFTLRDGRVIAQSNYDCYEPFGATV